MDDDLLMRLADCGGPEKLAECIAKSFKGMRIPVPVEDVARAVGISEINPVTSAGFEGILVADEAKTKGAIAYNDQSRPERIRFTIAHEIGHFLIPTHDGRAQCAKVDLGVVVSSDVRRAKEAEANRFAACLLMPQKQFLTDIRKLGAPEIDHVLKLSNRYEVSKEAAARRYADLAPGDCAFVFSHTGVVRSCCKAKGFPFLTAKIGERLPAGSHSARSSLAAGRCSEWREVEQETWLGREYRSKVLFEQILAQANGYAITMLTLDAAEGDPSEEEDDAGFMERSWEPRFRR